MARTRKPTPEEAALFRRAAADARPLSDDRTHHVPARRSTRPVRAAPCGTRDETLHANDGAFDSPERGEPLAFATPGVQTRVRRQLRRGQIRPEDDLDLHGMTATQAARALERFLRDARETGVRCVRIVHGKGTGSPDGRPTLKGQLNRWLRSHEAVVAFASTIPRDGGTGAVYVLLRSPER